MKVKLLSIFTVIGLIVSIYLTYKSNDPSSVVCSIGGACEIVLSSKYAYIFGIPVSLYGALWYVAMLVLIFLTFISKKLDQNIIKLAAVSGAAFSLYLLGIEMFVLHAYCTWCLVSLVMVVLINYLIFIKKEK